MIIKKKPFFLEGLFLYICFMNENLDPSSNNLSSDDRLFDFCENVNRGKNMKSK